METMEVTEKIRGNVSDIEEHTALDKNEKVSRVIHIGCASCAAVGAQPVPFADIFLLATLQAYFVSRIAAIRGVEISEADARICVKALFGMVGLGIVAEQFAVGIWKLMTFGFGGIFTVALDYAMTYAVMNVADAYFSARANSETLTRDQVRAIWKSAFREGKTKGATEKQKIKARKQH